MSGARAYSQLAHPDQWARCAHQTTALLPDGSVTLTWFDADAAASAGQAPPARGLAFDEWCRAFVSRPVRGRVDVLPSGTSRLHEQPPHEQGRGGFDRPTGLAVDRRQRLYVLESGAGVVRVLDLRGRRLLRRFTIGQGRPVDVAADCGRSLVLTWREGHAALLVVDGRHGPRAGPTVAPPCFAAGAVPRRLASARVGSRDDRCPLLLWRAPDGRSAITRVDGTVLLEVVGATDLDLDTGGRLVVGLLPGQPIRQFLIDDGQAVEQEPLLAPSYDGGAIALAPNGRVAFTTRRGIGWTAGTAARRARHGRVVSYRLDSQSYRTRWGRAFLDACVPTGTSLGLRFVTTDEDVVLDPLPVAPPDRGARDVPATHATPPLPPEHLLEVAGREEPLEPYRRPRGAELPWPRPGTGSDLDTFEVPVHAAPGRYLWVEVTLRGTDTVSPRVARLRVERPGHALLGSLPRSWSREEAHADFLQRFLTAPDGMLHESDQRAAERAALVHPGRVPSEALAWLASFAGLTLDRRWPEPARRTLVAETYRLYRRRGTLACLTRILEIYLGYPPALVESWRLRGLAGTTLGTIPLGAPAETVGGAGSRTSALGQFQVGGDNHDRTAYDATAHRFTVLVPGCLDPEARAVVEDVLASQRPAHTLVEICELGDGMRLGQTVRPGLTAYVGPAHHPRTPVLGRTGTGVDTVTGETAGIGSRLGETGVGEVRVG